jgi:hypothetical protein
VKARARGLPDQVVMFARTYAQMTEALQAEGVPEPIAREEARMAAVTVAYCPEPAEGPPCPLCGR